ncbi:unnamed protein product [Lupinus luteus]|uniref:Transmembrane protein n=1 Tax=Lupinus luteus TaxID=3873 RepID=A0AAV1X0T2_LUPLU
MTTCKVYLMVVMSFLLLSIAFSVPLPTTNFGIKRLVPSGPNRAQSPGHENKKHVPTSVGFGSKDYSITGATKVTNE